MHREIRRSVASRSYSENALSCLIERAAPGPRAGAVSEGQLAHRGHVPFERDPGRGWRVRGVPAPGEAQGECGASCVVRPRPPGRAPSRPNHSAHSGTAQQTRHPTRHLPDQLRCATSIRGSPQSRGVSRPSRADGRTHRDRACLGDAATVRARRPGKPRWTRNDRSCRESGGIGTRASQPDLPMSGRLTEAAGCGSPVTQVASPDRWPSTSTPSTPIRAVDAPTALARVAGPARRVFARGGTCAAGLGTRQR